MYFFIKKQADKVINYLFSVAKLLHVMSWPLAPIFCPRCCSTSPSHPRFNKKSLANAEGNARQLCMFESPIKQNQSPEGARRPAAKCL